MKDQIGLGQSLTHFDAASERIIRELLEQISKRNDRLNWLRAEHQRLTEQLVGDRQLIQKQQRDLAEREKAVAELTKQIDQSMQATQALKHALVEKDEHADRIVEDRERLARDLAALKTALSSQRHVLEEKECQLSQLSFDQERLAQDSLKLQVTLRDQQKELANKDLQILDLITQQDHSNHQLGSMGIRCQEKERELTELRSDQERVGRDVSILQATVQHQRTALETVYGTLGWLLTNRFRPVKAKLLLPGSRITQLYDSVLAALKERLRNGYPSPINEIRSVPFGPLVRKESENEPSTRKNGTINAPTARGAVRPVPRFGGRQFAIYTSSLGNYFFSEFRDLLVAGFQSLGLQVEMRDERQGFSEVADWHLVVAPHEFFYLGAGQELCNQPSPSNLILFNTEQPSTQWYARARHCFSKAYGIWDINHTSSQEIAKEGFSCEYLPLGYLPNFKAFQEVEELPNHYGTCFLDEKIRKNTYLDKPFAERPIEVLFLGTLSARREKFFVHASRVLSNHSCYLHLPGAEGPLLAGLNTTMDTTTSIGLAQRSKIMLNIHRGADRYFEWHRIVMHGIWNRTLVITEPCGDGPPFQPGVHFVEAPLGQISDVVEYYLTDAKGQAEAEAITLRGYQMLSEQCKLTDCLRPLLLRSCRIQLSNYS